MKKFAETVIKNGGGFFGVNENGEMTYEIKGLKSSPLIIFGDWISPEDHQFKVGEIQDDLSCANEEIERLNAQLKKQQREIPEFVAEFIKNNLDQSKNLQDLYEEELFHTGELYLSGSKYDFISWFNENTTLFEKAWTNGYTVAKEKRFYLKHIDFCKRDKDYDWYMIKHSDGPLNHLRVEKETLPPTVDTYFTQQEIDSMAADSYEQIEVEE